jgi:hypothetical protein
MIAPKRKIMLSLMATLLPARGPDGLARGRKAARR